jgi:hypothetical protein
MKNISFKSALSIMALGILFVTSCKKSNDVQAVSGDGDAAVSGITSTLITGRWGTSFNPSSYDTVYVNLSTGAQADTSNAIIYHMFMRSSNNSRLYPAPGYTMKWLYDNSTPYASLSLSSFVNTVGAAGLGSTSTPSTPDGYFYYPTPGDPQPVPGFYIALVPNAGGTSYVFTATDIIPEGVATNNRGKYQISRGVIN